MAERRPGSKRGSSGLTVRARLTLIAAGVVAAALAIGGPLWAWGVEFRMLEDLRERDRLRVVIEGLIHSRDTFGRMGPGPPGPGSGPGPKIKYGRRPRGDPFQSSDVLVLEPGREPVFAGRTEESPEDLLAWLKSIREEGTLDSAADEVGSLFAEVVRARRECRPGLRGGRRGSGEAARFPPDGSPDSAREACWQRLEDARDRAVEHAAQIPWPQIVAADGERGRSLRTAILVNFPAEDQPRAIAIQSSLASVDATLQALRRSFIYGGPLLVALVGMVAWLLVGRSLRVVGEMNREIEGIAFGALDRRLRSPTTRDEVSSLVDTLNRMLDRIDEGARRQREFIGDASHELRTPIATIRTQLEVALSHPDKVDWIKLAGEANEEVLRMQQLVDDLLRIARLDDATEERLKSSQEVDLDDIVRQESAALHGARVGLSGVSPVRVRGAEQDLRRIVRNLLENAERYGGGRVEVSLCQIGDQARLEIEDDGPGIPVKDRDRVFERFTRMEESRSRSRGGAGLGLSLARGLAEAHGGRIEIESARIGGARVIVTLPLGH